MKEKFKIEVGSFLKDLTFGMQYKFLEQGKDDDELQEIAKKHHLRLPAKDLSILKGLYAFVDEENRNGCTLPRKEVEKALDTLNGKSVDFDHFRKKIVGYWLEGNLTENDEIIAYAIFFKGSLEEEFDEIKTLLEEGNLKISFEAWGNREFKDKQKTSYDLTDIEFAGGALLINTKPAFANAKVLEMAKVMSEPKSYIKGISDEENTQLELSRFYIYDLETILRVVQEVKPKGVESGWHEIMAIDFAGGMVKTKFMPDDIEMEIKITPRVVKQGKPEKGGRELVEAKELTKSSKEDDFKDKNKTKAVEESKKMEEKIKQLEAEIAKFTAQKELADNEIASLREKIREVEGKLTEANTKIEQAEAKIANFDTEKAEAVTKAKEQATVITSRKAELGDEYTKDMKDEDILDDTKYELAKVKKERDALKKAAEGNPEVASDEKTDLTVGSKDKEKINKSASRVRDLAFGKQ